MADLPFPWGIYGENQLKVGRFDRVTDLAWGIENGLSHLLTAVESNGALTNQEQFRRSVERAIATGSWRERNRARLRQKHLRQSNETNPERPLLVRARLAEIRNSVTAAEWALLLEVAAGFTCAEMARVPGTTIGSIRTRISRLRARLRTG